MKKLLYSFILIGIFFQSFSQEIRNFSSLTGKKDVPANCIIQGQEGYMWFGTNEGLIRFDGKKTKIFTTEEGLNSNEVSAIYQDKEKTIWVGHKNGKISYIKKNTADTFQLNNKLGEEKITGFYSDASGKLWISTYGSGIYTYEKNELKQYTTKEGLGDDLIYVLCPDNKGNIWLGTDVGITIIDPSKEISKISIKTFSSKEGLPDNIVRSLCYSKDGRMIISMQDSGLCFYDTKKSEIIKNSFFSQWSYGAIDGVAYIKERDEILFATEKKGLFSIRNSAISIYDQSKGLLADELNSIFVDREYNIWLASKKGISQLFDQRQTMLTNAQGLPSNIVYSLCAEDEHSLWFATDMGLSELMKNETGGYAFKNMALKELEGNQVVSMMHDTKHRIWMGTYGKGIIIYDTESGKTQSLNVKSGLSNDNISNIVIDKEGIVWVATLGGGLCKITELDGKFNYACYNEENGLGSSYVYQVLISKKGKVLLAVDGEGLQSFESDKITSISKGLKSKTVYSLVEDNKGTLWLSTSDDGIVSFNGKEFKSFTTKNGLRDQQPPVLSIVDNKLVLVHTKGLDIINTQDPSQITQFNISDNDLEPNLNAWVLDKDNELWVATNTGLLKYRAYDNFYDTITPKSFITNFRVQYKDFPIDSITEFDPGQNTMMFEFSAVFLKSSENINFRYMLKGSDADWMYTMGVNVASYNNLAPGNYEFMVEASNNEGKWGPPTSFAFTIAKPLWMKWWFWVLVASATIALVYVFVQYRLRALQKEKMVLEQKVEERTAEITKQTKIIEEKNKSLEQLSLVASKTDNVVLIMDAKGEIEYVNESFTRLNKLNLEQLRAATGGSIFDSSNNPRIRDIIKDCIDKRQSVVYESVNNKVEGNEVWESSTLTPIFDEQGNLKKLIIIDTDISERKKQEQIIVQKNKDITDSIEYAHKIQTAILPQDTEIKNSLPKSFVFYLMKDIVSGDFYWFTEKDDFCIIAAIDCTGHGVPGAFMSLIGYNILNQIVNEKNIHEPAQILQYLNEGVIQALYKNNPGSQNKDGMDLAMCKIYKNSKRIEYAGAMRPLWIVSKEGEVSEVRPTKMPIGSLPTAGYVETEYVNNVIDANDGDTFYIFTDGYADQFGGEKSKKFTTGKLKQLFVSMKDENMKQQKETLQDVHLAWKHHNEQVDDILVIGFQV